MNAKAVNSNPTRRLTLLTLLSLAGVVVSAILSQHFYEVRGGTAAFKSFCNVSSKMNCDVIAASPYAELVAGIPLSSFAAGWFLALAIISIIARDAFWRRESLRAAFGLTVFGGLMSAVYILIMGTVLKTWCLYCLMTEGLVFASLGVVLSLKPEGFRAHKPERQKWKTLAGTAAASVIVAVLLLKAMESSLRIPDSEAREIADGVAAAPPVAVASGEEFPSVGPVGAPITIVEFSDFQCPHCRAGAFILNSVMNRFPGKVRVVLRNFPLDSSCNRTMQHSGHPVACEAARAALCSSKEGKFQEVYEKLFEHQTSLRPGRPLELAREAGIDEGRMQGCMASPEIAAAVSRDIEEGMRLGVQSTPTFFINGRKVEGAYPVQVWTRIIEQLLKTSS